LQAIAHAAISAPAGGGLRCRFPPASVQRPQALDDWKKMSASALFEQHPEWRRMSWGQARCVQDPANGGLLSGGILE